jgi:hypothetical protein
LFFSKGGGYSFVMEREKEKGCRSEMVRISEEELDRGLV